MEIISQIFRWIFTLLLILIITLLTSIAILAGTLALTFRDAYTALEYIEGAELTEYTYPAMMQFLIRTAPDKSENEIIYQIYGEGYETAEIVGEINDDENKQRIFSDFIEAMYAWLEGRTTFPQFSIKFTNNAEDHEKLVFAYYTTEVEKVPLCKAFSDVPEGFDPLSARCRPQSFNSTELEASFERLKDSDEYEAYASKVNIESERLIEIEQTTSEQIQLYFKLFLFSSLILGFIVLILGLLYSWFYPSKGRGMISFGSIILSVGAIFATLSYFIRPTFAFIFEQLQDRVVLEEDPELYAIASELAIKIFEAFKENMLIVSVIVAVIGMLIFLFSGLLSLNRNRGERKVYTESL